MSIELSASFENMEGCISAKKLALNKTYLKARLSWTKRHELWNTDAWNKITFSNEIRMDLHSNGQENSPPNKNNEVY